MRGSEVLTANEEADFGANWQANKGGYPSEQAGQATKRKANHAAHQGSGTRSPQGSTALFGPTVVENQGKTKQRVSAADFLLAPRKARDPQEEAWWQAERDHKEAAHAAAQRKANHTANQGSGMRSPQGLTALFGSTVGKKGKTGQGVSAADFLPAPRKPTHAVHQGGGMRDPQELVPSGSAGWSATPAVVTGTQYKKEAAIAQGARGRSNSPQVSGAAATGRIGQGASAASFLPSQEPYNSELEIDSEAEEVPGDTVKATNQAAMRILADIRSVRGTTASRLARATRTAKAAPSWPGIGAYYAAWVRALRREPTNPEAAINEDAPERAYLAVMNGNKHLSVLHHLHWWRAHDGGRSCLDGYIVAFEGEVRDANGIPLLWRFDEEEAGLPHPGPLPAFALNHASLFYREGDKDDRFHNRRTPSPPGGQEETIKTFGRLIPIPVGWATMFLDRPSFGVTFCRVIQLMLSTDPAERSHL
jgi:hypothetical protein